MTNHDGTYVYQINISNGGVPKCAVEKAYVSINGLEGDRQKNRKIHGGTDRALCLYSLERLDDLRAEGHDIQPGSSGENLTIAGLDWSVLRPGDHMRIGPCLQIAITGYAEPCRHNARWFRDNNYKRISQKMHPGWSRLYAQVLTEGTVHHGDSVCVNTRNQ
ncbi:MAG: MOSC domain-containing protein [Nitrospirales bacterium]|nr:MOSC domain-containing protein [Nitrospira sp.]MDR4501078.1 MOSC domain-containing protein [Nitrospirales bacterium]